MTTATTALVTVSCCRCTESVEREPLSDGRVPQPRGWHRLGELLWCPACWQQSFSMRAISLPVASVVEGYDGEWTQQNCRAGWQALRAALRQSSRQAAEFSNLALSLLFSADTEPLGTKLGGDGKTKTILPKLPSVDLYSIGRDQFPELDSQSLGSLRQKVTAKYREKRWELRVTRKTSLPNYRDCPVPLPSKDARLTISHKHHEDIPEEDRKPGTGVVFLKVRIAGKRFTLRLRTGSGDRGGRYSFLRKIAALEKIEAGKALQGEVSLLERSASAARGNAGSDRAAPGSPKFATEVFATISIWLPKEKGERRDLEILVRTGPERLWTVFVGAREEASWLLHEDAVRRRVIAHRRQLQRLSLDTKFERRSRIRGAPVQPPDLASRRKRLVDNHKRFMDDWCHKAAAMLAGFAKRQGAMTVKYDDSDTSFAASLPWFKLRSLVEQKLSHFGINFVRLEKLDATADNPDA